MAMQTEARPWRQRRPRQRWFKRLLEIFSTLLIVNTISLDVCFKTDYVEKQVSSKTKTEDPMTHYVNFIRQLDVKRNCSNLEGSGGLEVLKKVREGLNESRRFLQSRVSPKIFCMVYTVDLPNSRRNIGAIIKTWGRQCDGFLAASNVTDHLSVNVPHKGSETYNNMWQKVRGMWKYVLKHYVNDFDYFYICGDDTYVIVDNLRAYLLSDEISKKTKGELDIFAKHQMKKKKKELETKVLYSSKTRPRPLLIGMPQLFRRNLFPSGGPGYVINQPAVRLWEDHILPNMFVNITDSREDFFTGSAFQSLGVIVTDTRDKSGAWRFNIENAEKMSKFRFQPLGAVANNLHLKGIDGVSKQSIAFHAKVIPDRLRGNIKEPFPSSDLLLRYHSVLEGLCDD